MKERVQKQVGVSGTLSHWHQREHNMEAPGPNLDQTSSSSSENVVSDNNSDCGAVNLIPKGRNGPLDDKIAEFAVENKHSLHLLSITR